MTQHFSQMKLWNHSSKLKTPQDLAGWGWRGAQRVWQLTQQRGGPPLLLNRLVSSTLSAAAQSRPLLYSPLLHYIRRGQTEPRRSQSHAATELNPGPSQQDASLQKPWLLRTLIRSRLGPLASAAKVLWKTLLAWTTLRSARCIAQSGKTEWCTMQGKPFLLECH